MKIIPPAAPGPADKSGPTLPTAARPYRGTVPRRSSAPASPAQARQSTPADGADAFKLDLRTSCARDEAVAKLIGWMRSPIRRAFVEKREGGISADQMREAPSLLGGSLQQRLEDVRAHALQQLMAAPKGRAAADEIERRLAAFIAAEKLIERAFRFGIDFDAEVADRASSRIRIDEKATRESGVEHYTLDSIERWARDHYGGLSVLDEVDARREPGDAVAQGPGQQPVTADVDRPTKRTERWVNNLLTTFAVAVETIADRPIADRLGNKFRHDDGSVNVAQVAEELHERAKKANNGEPLGDHGVEVIKDRIEAAMKAKKAQLPANSAQRPEK